MTPSEEYALFVEQVNKLAEHRQNITTIHLSVNAAVTQALSRLALKWYCQPCLTCTVDELTVPSSA